VPMQTVAIPMFMQIKFFDFFGLGRLIGLIPGLKPIILPIYNTQWALLLPALLGNGIRGGLYIYIFRQFFRGMPLELEDAANIDGCGFMTTFTKIIIPLSRPPILVVFILSIIWYWNDIFITSLFFSKSQTLAMLVDGLAARFALEYDLYQVQVFQQAGSLLMISPVLLMYLFLQRYFMRSIDQTGLK
jgi:multiple sugar transport system permease protein